MDVADKFPEVGVLLDDDGLVAILEEMPDPFMAAVVGPGITGEEPAQEPGEPLGSAPQQQVGMIREEGSCVERRAGGRRPRAEARDERLAILGIGHDLPPLLPAEHHMVQRAGSIESRLPGHRVSPLPLGGA